MRRHILILGGTTEARHIAAWLADRTDLDVTLSLAGRTATPLVQPTPVRSGGFGGADGLAAYLRSKATALVVDATHPYASRISANAYVACTSTGVPLLAVRRPPWRAQPGDRWTEVSDADAAIGALGLSAQRVFLALGRQELAPFVAAPQHHYLVRSVDPVNPPLAVPSARYIVARGPFSESQDRQLLVENSITAIVAKNSGGDSTYGKIAAARSLGIDVVLLRRPPQPVGSSVATVAEAVEWLAHEL